MLLMFLTVLSNSLLYGDQDFCSAGFRPKWSGPLTDPGVEEVN